MILGYILPNNERFTINWEPRGKLVLENNEEIIENDFDIQINYAKYGWDSKFDLDYALDKGVGEVIKTNKRLKNMNRPCDNCYNLHVHPSGTHEECCEIIFSENTDKKYFEKRLNYEKKSCKCFLKI